MKGSKLISTFKECFKPLPNFVISSIVIEIIETVLFFFMKDILNVKKTQTKAPK